MKHIDLNDFIGSVNVDYKGLLQWFVDHDFLVLISKFDPIKSVWSKFYVLENVNAYSNLKHKSELYDVRIFKLD